jgi:site-specific DNA-methyltransferase (adenine-specific)
VKGSAAFYNRIICGDSLRVLKDLPDRSVDLIITDPPYGDNIGYGRRNIRIQGNEHPLLALMVMSASYRVLKRNSNAYMFCGSKHIGFLRAFFMSYTRFKIRDVVIWDKAIRGRGYGFRRQYECILVLEKGKPRYRNPGLPNLIRAARVGTLEHPHTKPLELIKTLLRQSSDEGDVILDPFLGSGTTVIAAHHLNRHYIGIEIDPRYYELAKARLKRTDDTGTPFVHRRSK